jgi:hypothetical protein
MLHIEQSLEEKLKIIPDHFKSFIIRKATPMQVAVKIE